MSPGRPDVRVVEIDLDLLARMLSERLDDFEEFACHVEHWLDTQADT